MNLFIFLNNLFIFLKNIFGLNEKHKLRRIKRIEINVVEKNLAIKNIIKVKGLNLRYLIYK